MTKALRAGFTVRSYRSNPRRCLSRVRRTPIAWRRSWLARIRERSAGRSRRPWWSKYQVSKCPPLNSVRRGLVLVVVARRHPTSKGIRRCRTAVPSVRAENRQRHGTARTARRGELWHHGGLLMPMRWQPL